MDRSIAHIWQEKGEMNMLYDVDRERWVVVAGKDHEDVVAFAKSTDNGLPPATGWSLYGKKILARFAMEVHAFTQGFTTRSSNITAAEAAGDQLQLPHMSMHEANVW